jgi:hypothetical protein
MIPSQSSDKAIATTKPPPPPPPPPPTTINIYHLFLRLLFLNLKESANSSSNASAWRTFKGRLYTRLHDKRIAELDLSGIINLAYLFFVLIKCFTSSALKASTTTTDLDSQLKHEQFENFFRILNVFNQTKSLTKLENILSLNKTTSNNGSSSSSSSAKLNAIKTIMKLKFAALGLWFEGNDLNNVNNEEIEAIFIRQELAGAINKWLSEASEHSLLCENNQGEQQNQISSFRNSQVISQFLCDIVLGYIEDCSCLVLNLSSDRPLVEIYQLALASSQILGELNFEIIFKLQSRKQNEQTFAKLTEIFLLYK